MYLLFAQELIKQKFDGETKVEACQRAAGVTLNGTAPSGRGAIQTEVDELATGWENYQRTLDKHDASLRHILAKWDAYTALYDSLALWLKDAERKGKDVALCGTLEEKRLKVAKLKVT